MQLWFSGIFCVCRQFRFCSNPVSQYFSFFFLNFLDVFLYKRKAFCCSGIVLGSRVVWPWFESKVFVQLDQPFSNFSFFVEILFLTSKCQAVYASLNKYMRPTTKFIFPLWTQILFLRLKNFYTTQNPIRGLPSFFIISIQFSSLIAIFTSTFCCTIWFLFWTGFDELSISNRSYLLILLVFSFSVCIELLAEPIIIEQLKSGRFFLF